MRRLSLAAIAIYAALNGQSTKLEFEVVSIKPADPSAPGRMTQSNPGGLRLRNLRVFELMTSAFQISRDQIIGGPNWLETAGWDIDARFPSGVDPGKAPQMMQAMLADRFQLVTHRETRDLPIYVLTVSKSGLKLSEGDGKGGMSSGPRFIRYNSATMIDLARQLRGYLGRAVVDRTGLTGQYAINLTFADVNPGADVGIDAPPSLFQALQDQAGLKLESAKGPIEILVIDHVEKPSPN